MTAKTIETLIADEPTVRSTVGYLVQYGYVGGTVASPLVYWADDALSFTTEAEAFARLRVLAARLRDQPNRFHTGEFRVVEKTETVVCRPIFKPEN